MSYTREEKVPNVCQSMTLFKKSESATLFVIKMPRVTKVQLLFKGISDNNLDMSNRLGF